MLVTGSTRSFLLVPGCNSPANHWRKSQITLDFRYARTSRMPFVNGSKSRAAIFGEFGSASNDRKLTKHDLIVAGGPRSPCQTEKNYRSSINLIGGYHESN